LPTEVANILTFNHLEMMLEPLLADKGVSVLTRGELHGGCMQSCIILWQ